MMCRPPMHCDVYAHTAPMIWGESIILRKVESRMGFVHCIFMWSQGEVFAKQHCIVHCCKVHHFQIYFNSIAYSFLTTGEGACGIEVTGRTPALSRKGMAASDSDDSAYGEEEGDTSLSDSDLEQELEMSRAEVAAQEYVVLGRPLVDLPVF